MTSKLEKLDVTPHEGEHPVPVAWWIFAAALVVWGAWYLWTYSPAMGGWSQGEALQGDATLPGLTVFATILFTAVATLVAGGLLFGLSLKKKVQDGGGGLRPTTGRGQSPSNQDGGGGLRPTTGRGQSPSNR